MITTHAAMGRDDFTCSRTLWRRTAVNWFSDVMNAWTSLCCSSASDRLERDAPALTPESPLARPRRRNKPRGPLGPRGSRTDDACGSQSSRLAILHKFLPIHDWS